MKKIIYSFLILALPSFSFAGDTEFSYDKNSLTDEFCQLDKVAAYVDETKVSYTELSQSPVFKGNIELTNAIAVKPNLKFEDLDWGAFAWGFCCWPVGVFTVLINDNKDKTAKDSFWAGLASVTIATTVSYIAVYAFLIASFGGF